MLGVAGIIAATQAAAQITFYEREDFRGPKFTTTRPLGNFERFGFNDRASSAVVAGNRWEVCEDARFEGRCVVLRPGQYPTLASMGLDNRISSVREISRNARVPDERYAPVGGDYRRRERERIYEADVTSVRAVVGPPERRCWIEREQVVENRGDASIPGAIVGGVIGGILGHQIGGGRGQDVATVGGAVGGAVVGANIGRQSGGQQVVTRDVERCATRAHPDRVAYWDVTYWFRGQEHRVQMTAPPGPTLAVNADGEPRV
jgi:uncharacterized protein YcfJ